MAKDYESWVAGRDRETAKQLQQIGGRIEELKNSLETLQATEQALKGALGAFRESQREFLDYCQQKKRPAKKKKTSKKVAKRGAN